MKKVPANITVQKNGNELKITCRRFSWTNVAGIIMISIVAYILSGFIKDMLLTSQGIFLCLAPIAVFYWCLAGIVNTSFIIMDDTTLRVYQRPLPWPGNKYITLSETDRRFYCNQLALRNKSGETVGHQCGIDMFSENGARIRVLSDINYESALFIKEELQKNFPVYKKELKGGS